MLLPRRTPALLLIVPALLGCKAAEGPPMDRPATASASATTATANAAGCRIVGAKLLGSTLGDAELCARFMAPIRKALPAGSEARVELAIRPRGMMSADVTLVRGGVAAGPVNYGMAVSDRALRVEDLDLLAKDVAKAVSAR